MSTNARGLVCDEMFDSGTRTSIVPTINKTENSRWVHGRISHRHVLTFITRGQLVPVLVRRIRLDFGACLVIPRFFGVAQELSRFLLVVRERVPVLDG